MSAQPVIIGDCTLYQGDCLEILPTLEAGSVDAVVTDPPYFAPAQHYCTRKSFGRAASDLSILQHFFNSLAVEWARIVHQAGRWFVFCDGQSYPLLYLAGYSHVKAIRPLIWDKQVAFNGYTFRHQHELIMWADMLKAIPIPTGRGDILRMRAIKVDDREHPAEKPPELIVTLIDAMDGEASSIRRANRILDPFMGSGVTGVACAMRGRKFIGIEKESRYFDIACKRIEKAYSEQGLYAETAVSQ